MFELMVIGAGQLGSRYLQGLVRLETPHRITVIDPSPSSLETAKGRWVKAGGDICHHQVTWRADFPADLKAIDLALVSTSAKERAHLVQHIAFHFVVRHWVLEKVLAQSVDDVKTITQATTFSEGAWVNTPRRMMSWHQSLKNAFKGKGPVEGAYSGGLWGLACNSIHFIDLFAWWTDERLGFVDVSNLSSAWFESKRTGYFEVTGKLVAHFSGGSTLALESREQADAQPLRVNLADGTIWKIDEVNGVALSTNGDHIDGNVALQSQISDRLVADILLRGQCGLPTVNESSEMHAVFLEAMLSHWNRSRNRNDVCVPIT